VKSQLVGLWTAEVRWTEMGVTSYEVSSEHGGLMHYEIKGVGTAEGIESLLAALRAASEADAPKRKGQAKEVATEVYPERRISI
jgi:hypothetical protein